MASAGGFEGAFRHGGVVWLVDGNQLIRVHPHHIRAFSESEQLLDSISQPEVESYQELIRQLPRHAVTDLREQDGPAEDDFEEPLLDVMPPPAGSSSTSPADFDRPRPSAKPEEERHFQRRRDGFGESS